MKNRSYVFAISMASWLILFFANCITAQEVTVQTVVDHIQSELAKRDSALLNYTVKMDMKYMDYKDDPPKVERTEQQEWIFRDGELAERKSAAEDDDNNLSSETDTSQVTKEMRMGDPLAIFESPDQYHFTLESRTDSLLQIEVIPREPAKESYQGTFTLRKSGLQVLRADLKPGATIPHVTSAETKVDFTTFLGYPVTQTVTSRFKGKYLLFLSFDKGIKIKMSYIQD